MKRYLIKIPIFTHASRGMLILRQGREAWSFDLYGQMIKGFGSLSVDLRSCRRLLKVQRTELKLFVEP